MPAASELAVARKAGKGGYQYDQEHLKDAQTTEQHVSACAVPALRGCWVVL
jgi:hypothetical protein